MVFKVCTCSRKDEVDGFAKCIEDCFNENSDGRYVTHTLTDTAIYIVFDLSGKQGGTSSPTPPQYGRDRTPGGQTPERDETLKEAEGPEMTPERDPPERTQTQEQGEQSGQSEPSPVLGGVVGSGAPQGGLEAPPRQGQAESDATIPSEAGTNAIKESPNYKAMVEAREELSLAQEADEAARGTDAHAEAVTRLAVAVAAYEKAVLALEFPNPKKATKAWGT